MTTRFDDALLFASELHRAQFRKGGCVPYLAHLMAVASLVLEYGGGEDQAIAALLHDSIEDQARHYAGGRAGLRAEILRRFGQPVLDIVNACTDDEDFQKQGAHTWRERKEAYLRHLETAGPAALLVSCADKLHNARTILADFDQHGHTLWRRFSTGSCEDQIWCYRSLADAFTARGVGPLAAELERTVAELERVTAR